MLHWLNRGYLGGLLLMALLLGGCAATPPQTTVLPEYYVGQQLFNENCASCHGSNGMGNPMMLRGQQIDFSDSAWQKMRTDAEIEQTIRQGKGMMPAFETTFTDEQLADLVKYIRSLSAEASGQPSEHQQAAMPSHPHNE